MGRLLAAVLLAIAPTAALGQVVTLLDQTSSPEVGLALSQVEPGGGPTDTIALDDFTTFQAWRLGELTVFGSDTGSAASNIDAIAQIFTGRPGVDETLIADAPGVQIGDDLFFDFGGFVLPPGDYVVAAFVVRPTGLGEWSARRIEEIAGDEHGAWLPGLAIPAGFATDVLLTSGFPGDLRLTLEAEPDALVDCDGDGLNDWSGIALGGNRDTNENGIPDLCERFAGADYDIDGIPDGSDTQPYIYDVWEEAPAADASVVQLSFPATDYNLPAATTEHGEITVTFPSQPGVHLLVNIEVDGRWVIRNHTEFTDVSPFDTPTQDRTYYFDLDVFRGTPVASVDVRLWIDPVGLGAIPMPGMAGDAAVRTIAVTQGEFDTGSLLGIPDPMPVPDATDDSTGAKAISFDKEDPPPPPDAVKRETDENAELEVADLDEEKEKRSCGPNSVGGSFDWMNRRYKLCMKYKRGSRLRDADLNWLVQRFRRLMGTQNAKGTNGPRMKRAKNAMIRGLIHVQKDDEGGQQQPVRGLPLEVRCKGIPESGNGVDLDDAPTPQDILNQLNSGGDVEVLYMRYKQGSDGKWRRIYGHAVAVKSVTKQGDKWKMTFRHDRSQTKADGITTESPDLAEMTEDFDGDGQPETVWVLDSAPFKSDKPGCRIRRVIEGYVSEIPSATMLLRLLTRLWDEFKEDYDMKKADGIDQAEKRELLGKIREIQQVANWTRKVAQSQGQNFAELARISRSTSQVRREIQRGAQGGGNKSGGAAKGVFGDDSDALIDALVESINIQDVALLPTLLPPDLDQDGIPDVADNAPFDANFDQADLDGNGVPDILELDDPGVDCNDNFIVDAYEITIVDVIDYNLDGTPNVGLIHDLNGNGLLDDCENPGTWCQADINEDEVTDVFDFSEFVLAYGSSEGDANWNELADLNFDDTIDIFDFGEFVIDFGCPSLP